jgi:acyl dehydratase
MKRYRIKKYLFVFIPVFLLSYSLICSFTDTSGADKSEPQSSGKESKVEFKTVYPNVYDKDEQELVNMCRLYFSGSPKELAEKIQAQSDGKKMANGMEINPGVAFLKDYSIENDKLLTSARSLNPLNPFYTDPEYAKKSRYGGLIAAPMAVTPSGSFPYIPKGNDIWVSSDDSTIGRGLDHEITFYKPIYPGDTLNSEITEQSLTDVTDPKGSKVRRFRVAGRGNLYNQKGEKVMSAFYSAIETLKLFKDRSMAKAYDRPLSIAVNRPTDWSKIRARHVYTDADWDKIKKIWDKEYIRGAKILYWEDVKIGDEPAWTCDGPFTGENRGNSSEHYIVRQALMNHDTDKSQVELYKDSYGLYRVKGGVKDQGGNTAPPSGGQMPQTGQSGAPVAAAMTESEHPNARSSFMNTVGRNLATRLVTNWTGDDGWLYKFAWRLAFGMDAGRNMFPAEHDRPSYLLKVPYLKKQGKFMSTHGFEGDVAITKAYVCDKYVKDGAHYVELVVWCETIEGDIWSECYAVVELPSRGNK